MGREKRQPPSEEGPSAPLWMVTFSDCMNLLLTFFILLVTFSSYDEEPFIKLREAFQRALPSISDSKDQKKAKTTFTPTHRIMPTLKIAQGSEKPTLEKGTQKNLKEETEPSNYRDRKIFLISSDKIFYGKGTIISLQGRKILSTMASFLKKLPARVVVSENGQENTSNTEYPGVDRAWAVMEYLTEKQGLDKESLSLSATGTIAWRQKPEMENERMVEIALLERSIYN